MVKTHINITIDIENYFKLKKNKVNISNLINNFLTDYNQIKKPVINGEDDNDKIQDAKLQIIYLNKEVEKIQTKQNKQQEAKNKEDSKIKWIDTTKL